MDLSRIEQSAPDQNSLKAASKLRAAQKWPLLARNEDGTLVWGECQGSGATPYRVVGDLKDLGSKCSCPSRKFPCKHALALFWVFHDRAEAFETQPVPQWITEWLSRRRGAATGDAKPSQKTDIGAAALESMEPIKKTVAEAQLRRQKTAAETRSIARKDAMIAGFEDLEIWVADQLRLGVGGLLEDMAARCRQIAARLVDAKAINLAARLDELPGAILSLPREHRVEALIAELGALILLVRAFQATPDDPELMREIAQTEKKETLLQSPAALKVTGSWEVLAETLRSRKDRLIEHSLWLLKCDQDGAEQKGPSFALIQDFYPAVAGKRNKSWQLGQVLYGDLCFYPAALPLRALVEAWRQPNPMSSQGAENKALPWTERACEAEDGLPTRFAEIRKAAPWMRESPHMLPPGRLVVAAGGQLWWHNRAGSVFLPLIGDLPDWVSGIVLQRTIILWNGRFGHFLAGDSAHFGRIYDGDS